MARPTKYNPEMCDAIEEALAEGRSVLAASSVIGVRKSTIYEWMGLYPDFSDAVKRGQAKAADWWEERLREVAKGETSGNATSIIFGLKNRAPDDWSDMRTVDHKSSDGSMSPSRPASELTDDELASIVDGE